MYIRENEYGIIAKTDEVLKLNPNEWRVLSAIPRSNTIARISELTGLPYSTVIDVVKRLTRTGIEIHFIPHYDVMGLKPVFLLFESPSLEKVPLYTVRASKIKGKKSYFGVEGIVPEKLIDNYVDAFPEKPLMKVEGDEIKHWSPTGRLTMYVSGLGLVLPSTERLEEVMAAGKAPIERRERRWIDWIDLLVIIFKMKYAYTKLSEVARLIEDQLKMEAPSRQLMSYHYRTHVMSIWNYNSVYFRLNDTVVPPRLYIFEGKESKVIARTMVEMPYFFETLVNEGSAVVYAHPPCYTHKLVYEILSNVDAELVFGELFRLADQEFPWITAEALKYYHEKGEWLDPSQYMHEVTI
ncbi:MAG: hypothetical protein DRJ35_05010 [Thermoprotei archaeon]|nr:MAG: hypothetical protein DRJ35_05010 [Thermoprotei archaeon]